MTSTEWHIYGLSGVWGPLPAVSTSTGSPVVTGRHRQLISCAGNVTFLTQVQN